MEKYEKGPVLGEGTFGSVFKATHKETGQVVAIKKIRIASMKEGINVTALREIKLLKELKHPHIVGLLDVFPLKRNLALVFECMESDLEAVIKDRAIVLAPGDIKSYMKMLLEALAYCHKCWVLHRDIKPNNMLLAPTGELKLADFGLSRVFGSPDRRYTNQVFARWYRPPELLFGATLYGGAVDVWAAGCVFAELLLRKPWLPGVSDIDQLGKTFAALGTPDEATWPGVKQLPTYIEFQKVPPQPLRTQFPNAADDALELLCAMMALNPLKRCSAAEALQHPYFTTNTPLPTPPGLLARPQSRASNPLKLAPAHVLHISRAPGAAAVSDAAHDDSDDEERPAGKRRRRRGEEAAQRSGAGAAAGAASALPRAAPVVQSGVLSPPVRS